MDQIIRNKIFDSYENVQAFLKAKQNVTFTDAQSMTGDLTDSDRLYLR